jgi:hypothetical protein
MQVPNSTLGKPHRHLCPHRPVLLLLLNPLKWPDPVGQPDPPPVHPRLLTPRRFPRSAGRSFRIDGERLDNAPVPRYIRSQPNFSRTDTTQEQLRSSVRTAWLIKAPSSSPEAGRPSILLITRSVLGTHHQREAPSQRTSPFLHGDLGSPMNPSGEEERGDSLHPTAYDSAKGILRSNKDEIE